MPSPSEVHDHSNRPSAPAVSARSDAVGNSALVRANATISAAPTPALTGQVRPASGAIAWTNSNAAYASSGVWKTDDDGASWQAIFEDQPSTSIGDIAVAPSNPDIVWVGTGESNLYRASMPGMGVFKSIDGGRTFLHSGLTDTQTVARIVVHPANPDVVYVASAGPPTDRI